MTDEQQDILISAYLDDELSADERARVEQLLATSPEARQLVEELRSLRASLKQLPPHRLDAEFSARVLAKAEREIAAASPAPAASERRSLHGPESAVSRAQPASRWRWGRPFGWAALTLAAALVLLVTNRPEDERQMVRAPEKKERALSKLDRRASERINMPMAGQLSDKQVEPQDAPVAAPAPAPAATLAESIAESSDAAAKPQVPRAAEADQIQSFALSAENESARALTPSAVSGRDESDQELLVISVDVTPAAASSELFEQLLARHQIRTDAGPPSGAGLSDGSEEKEESARAAGAQAADDLSFGATPEARTKSKQTTAVYVEASRQQIDAALAELQATPQSFPAVAVAMTDQKQADPGAAPQRAMLRSSAPSGGVAQSSPAQSGAAGVGGLGGAGATPSDHFQGGQANGRAIAPTTSAAPAGPAHKDLATESRSGERGRLSLSVPKEAGSGANAQQAVPPARAMSETQAPPVRAVFVLRIVDPQAPAGSAPAK